ncbi:metal ABC transporter solute-binding protein, Zn/Mn family [Fortiea contorta]|uniref:metal ABC transporter solute-binding protein, Zn/Mn family n=1 Tax=Fortiea contorta TaxID=1892405 RepID=UPI000381B0C1|nr:zinc ABC transporter substrate-binding protein [Fortiea contorta]
MPKKLLKINALHVALLAISIGFFGCGKQAANTSFTQTTKITTNLPKVVATTSVLCDLTKQIAETTINLTCLISPGVDPHVYRPTPEDRKAIEQANLILYNGYNLEPGLIKTIKATKSTTPKIAVGQIAVPKPQQFLESGKRVSDPHVWLDAKNGIKMVGVISNSLTKLDASNAASYNNKKQAIINELTQLDRWIKSRIASIPPKRRKLVTAHNAFSYYAKAYGLSLAGTLEGLSTEQKPSSARVKSLTKSIQKNRVPVAFAETTTDTQIIQDTAKDAQVKVSERKLHADDIGEPGSEGESYQKMMIANTRTIVEGLGGTYLLFEPKRANNRSPLLIVLSKSRRENPAPTNALH